MTLRNFQHLHSEFITVLVGHAPDLLEVLLETLQRVLADPEIEFNSPSHVISFQKSSRDNKLNPLVCTC